MALDVVKTTDPYDFPSEEALRGLNRSSQVESLIEWFFHNFEDPAQNTPYESAEGGYQYIWGDPDDAREQLDDRFARFVDPEVIEEAVDRIEQDGVDWVPSNTRIVNVPEDDEVEEENEPTSIQDAVSQVATSLKSFEAALDALDGPGIGHNQPPGPINDPALSPEDIGDTRATIAALKDEITSPIILQANLLILSDEILSVAKKVGMWLAKKADGAITAGLAAGAVVVGTETAEWVAERLFPNQVHFIQVANKLALEISHWVSLLPPPF